MYLYKPFTCGAEGDALQLTSQRLVENVVHKKV
jgi:hypothetical protein